jgi:hypothetical protein
MGKIQATAAKEISRDGRIENLEVQFKKIFVQMFNGGKCLLNMFVLHHLQLPLSFLGSELPPSSCLNRVLLLPKISNTKTASEGGLEQRTLSMRF